MTLKVREPIQAVFPLYRVKATIRRSVKNTRIVGFINAEVPRKALRSQKEERGHESEND
jgi:hypothetical protein